MVRNFTLNQLTETQKNENLERDLFLKEEEMVQPKDQTIANILNYSKALSVRETKSLDKIKMILN